MAGKRSLFVRLIVGAAAAALIWLAGLSLLWWAMHQPPERFGKVMARVPAPAAFLLFPFETLWTHARGGDLKPGDRAPDFSLQRVDKSGWVQLSTLNRERPVALVFGSYT